MKKYPKVIILHAQADNLTDGSNQKGWVDSLRHFLLIMLGQMTSQDVEVILRSEKDDHTREAYTDRNLLIPVFSAEFMQSELLLGALRTYLSMR